MTDKTCNEPLAPEPFPSSLSPRCEFEPGHAGPHGLRGRPGPAVTGCVIDAVKWDGVYMVAAPQALVVGNCVLYSILPPGHPWRPHVAEQSIAEEAQ